MNSPETREIESRADMMASRLRQAHDLNAYARDCRRTTVFFRHNYRSLLPKNESAKILEIGCGLGQFLHFCRTMGFVNSTGLDLSKENVSFCQAQGFDVELGDGYKFLESHEDTYDAIVLNDVIEHIPKDMIIPMLKLMHSRLNPDGAILMKTINMANPIMGAHSRYIDFTHTVGWTQESLVQVLEEAGFSAVKVYPSNLYVYYWNPLNYIALAITKFCDLLFLFYYRLNGRSTTTLFSKNLIVHGVRMSS